MAGEKGRESEGKIEKKRELPKGWRPKILLMKKSPLPLTPGVFNRQYTVQNYQKIKTSTITMGANKKVTKKKSKCQKQDE